MILMKVRRGKGGKGASGKREGPVIDTKLLHNRMTTNNVVTTFLSTKGKKNMLEDRILKFSS